MHGVSRKSLTDDQQADATRLRSVWDRKRRELGLTQEKACSEFGWSTQSAVSQYLNGRIALNLNALVKFASLLRVSPAEISPSLARELHGVKDPDARFSSMKVRGYDSPSDVDPSNHAQLKVIDAELSAGGGAHNGFEYEEHPIWFSRHTLRNSGVQEEHAVVVRIVGNSMEPVMVSGDTVGVDTADTNPIRDGKPYAIRDIDMIRVKILYMRPGGGLRLRSFNLEEYPDEDLSADEVRERITVIGRVFWSSRMW